MYVTFGFSESLINRKGVNGLELDNVYKRYADMVYRYLIALCGNADLAEELTQETFFRAVKHADSFDGKAKVTTWLCTIAKNTYFSYLKKEKRHPRCDIDEMELATEQDMLEQESCREIYKAVHRMEEPYREIMLLRIHSDLNFADIGEIFGRTEGWARVTFYRGKEKLKKLLEESE